MSDPGPGGLGGRSLSKPRGAPASPPWRREDPAISDLQSARTSGTEGTATQRELRVLVVDGDELARRHLRQLLRPFPHISVIGEFDNGLEAVPAIRIEQPDLVFLEVQLEGLDGFDVLRGVPPERLPEVVFVTAEDQHALQAFEFHALDYILKPVEADRLGRTLDRATKAIAQRRSGSVDERLSALLESLARQRGYARRLVIKSGNRAFFLPVEQIDWLEAADNYIRVHSGGNTYLMRETMSHLASQLDPEQYVRIHRSTIVNIACVREIQPTPSPEFAVVLHDGTRLTTSKSHRRTLQRLIDSGH